MQTFARRVRALPAAGEEGQTLTEYGLILILVSVAAVGALWLMRLALQDLYQLILDNWP